MRYFHICAHEQFPPDDLLRQAVEAEEAGFDGIGCSDHLQPWWEPGESGHAWVWLPPPPPGPPPGAVGPRGAPPPPPPPRPGGPPFSVSPFGSRAAAVAGRWADGLWTLADPERAPQVIDAYRSAAEDAGREPGEILLQVGFSWAEDDETALEGARVWKGAQPDEFYTDDWHDPKAMYERGEEQVSDEELAEAFILGSDPSHHAERIRAVEEIGATTVVLMNNSGADPHGAIRVYGDRVLP